MDIPKIKLYSLTTCTYCQAIKKFLANLGLPFEFVEADLLLGDERKRLLAELRQINPRSSFPTVTVGDRAIIGFKTQEILAAIGVQTEIDDLREKLRIIHEPLGYFFNRDQERTFELLRGLMTNRERYGYMACPCRLAAGEREIDADIICPCAYRHEDVEEFGACYCQLYVTADWNEDRVPHLPIPERRFS